MNFDIVPYEGAGPLRLGMTKDEVRTVMPEEPDDMHQIRAPYTDVFREARIFVYYTEENGVCEAIEFTEPTIAIFNGKQINGVSFIEAKNWLEKFDDGLNLDESGASSPKLGIGLYAPGYDEDPDSPVEAVIVFTRGYYETV